MRKTGATNSRSLVVDTQNLVWCKNENCTKREGEIGACLRLGHELIIRKIKSQKVY
jgi:hypothetical protein